MFHITARTGSRARCGFALGASIFGAVGHGRSVRSSSRSTYCSSVSGMAKRSGSGGGDTTPIESVTYRPGAPDSSEPETDVDAVHVVGAGGIGCAVGYA